MHSQLNYMIAQQRSTQLQRAGEHARLASDLLAGQRSPRDSKPLTRVRVQLARWTGRCAPTGP